MGGGLNGYERFYANIITQLGRILHAQCSLKTGLFEPCPDIN